MRYHRIHNVTTGITEDVPFTTEEETAADAAEASFAAGANDRLAAEVRKQRDSLLKATDWTQVADAPVNQAAWATYRQALRNIPTQLGFPSSVVWPTQP